MSTDDTSVQQGYVFKPALQDISLKRFRLRYSVYHDCYYLHWDNAVCPPLAKIDGLTKGIFSMTGIQRCKDDSSGEAYLTLEKGIDKAQIEWRMDFSSCGLVVSRLEVRARCGWQETDERINFMVGGDHDSYTSPELGDYYTEIAQVSGSKTVSIVASFDCDDSNNEDGVEGPLQLLTATEDCDCPLDIIVELMCARLDDEVYAGELLLGLKFTPEETDQDKRLVNGDIQISVATEMETKGGQLQVHIVEGAGIFDEDTRKPFNTFAKCDLLPDTGRFSGKQTSPKHNAYPTWAKEFFFNGVSRQDLVYGGLEVILYDRHHFFSDSNIGGMRMCVPQKKCESEFPDASPASSRSSSPLPPGLEDNMSGGSSGSVGSGDNSPTLFFSEHDIMVSYQSRSKSKSLPQARSLQALSPHSSPHQSPIMGRRSPVPHSPSCPNTLSPNVLRKQRSSSPSPKNSPLMAAKNIFRLSGSHLMGLSPRSSPRASPIMGRRKFRGNSRRNSAYIDSEYVHWWMEERSGGEVQHWKQMLDNEGEWVYFWHIIRPKLKSAY